MEAAGETRARNPATLVLHTDRLTLRSFNKSDVPKIVTFCNDIEVAKMLSVVPHPYTEANAEFFLNTVVPSTSGCHFAVVEDCSGLLVGSIGVSGVGAGPDPRKRYTDFEAMPARSGETSGSGAHDAADVPVDDASGGGSGTTAPRSGIIGYWFARSAWGRGIATEAAAAALEYAFSVLCCECVVGNYFLENTGSARVLQKLGFRQSGPDSSERCLARGGMELPARHTLLTRSTWESHPLRPWVHTSTTQRCPYDSCHSELISVDIVAASANSGGESMHRHALDRLCRQASAATGTTTTPGEEACHIDVADEKGPAGSSLLLPGLKRLQLLPSSFAILAMIGARPAALLVGFELASVLENKPVLYVREVILSEDMVTAPEKVQSGTAVAVVTCIESAARTRGCDEVCVDVQRSGKSKAEGWLIRACKSCGFSCSQNEAWTLMIGVSKKGQR